MPNYCTSCGAKVEQKHQFCLNCGEKLLSENNNTSSSIPKPPKAEGNNTTAIQPKKSNKIFLISLIAIIAVIIIIIVIVLLYIGRGVIDNRFIGEWEQYDEGYMSLDWNFKNDGSLELNSMNLASWSVKGDQLCIKTNELWDQYLPEETFDEICYNFKFSNNGNTLTLSINGSEYSILIKK